MVEVPTYTCSIRGRYVPKTLIALYLVFASQIQSVLKGLATAAATGVAGQHMSRRRDRGSSDVYILESHVW